MSGFKLDVTLEITNPNSTTIRTTGFTYKVKQKGDVVEAEGNADEGPLLAEGSMDDGIVIQGNDTSLVVIPICCSYGGVGSLGKSLLMGGRDKINNFVMSGETFYTIPMTETTYTLPYRVNGQFSPSSDDENAASEE